MPRYIFPAGTVTNTTGAPLRLTFHATSTTNRRETDLWTVSGSDLSAQIPNGVILTNSASPGAYSAFAGPDDVDTLYVVKHDSSTRTTITATSYVAGENTLLGTTYMPLAGSGKTITGPFYWRGVDDNTQIVAKPTSDGRSGVFDLIHNDTVGYLFHLIAGSASSAPGALLAMGLDNSNTTGLLVANKASGIGIDLDQRATVSTSTAYMVHATQRSTAAPLVRLEVQTTNAADVLQLLGFGTPAAGVNLLYVSDPTSQAGVIRAADGTMEWRRNITIRDKDGSTVSYLDVTENSGVAANASNHLITKKSSLEFYNYSGSTGLWWPFALVGGGSVMSIQAGGTTGTVGTTGTLATLIGLKSGKMGFFTANPITQPTRAGQLTDSSGGTSGGTTIAAVTDAATAANAIATLAAKYNALEAKLSQAGGGLGVTA